jgi:hypothetical protein
MNWLMTIAVASVGLAGGLYLLLGLAIIVTALVERRPVKFLAVAPWDDPVWKSLRASEPETGSPGADAAESVPTVAPGISAYAETRVHSAGRLGFTAPLLFKHVKGGIYKTQSVLMVSKSRQTLAVVRWGTTASIRNELTMLFSALKDGRYIVTSDRPTGSRTLGFYDDLVFLGADFEQLVRRHEERLRASGQTINRLSGEDPLAEYDQIQELRARFLVASGDAYWVDPQETEYRSTFKGALKMFAQTFSTHHVDRSLSTPVR